MDKRSNPSRFRFEMNQQKILGIVGWKNSGKTTLIEALLKEMTGHGLRISTIKHTHHSFEIDIPGKDSYRHRQAGAHEVLAVSSKRWALIHEIGDEAEPSLEDLVCKLTCCDLILAEGFKHGSHPKIEVTRSSHKHGLLADYDCNVIAVATDDTQLAKGHLALPLNDARAIGEFICNFFNIHKTKRKPL